MYFTILFSAIFLIIGLNLGFNPSWMTALNLLVSFALVLLPSLVCAIGIRLLPKKWFSYKHKVFKTGQREKTFLLKIGIKKWKDKIPELGQTVNFKKSNLSQPLNSEYMLKFITETCYAEILHISCVMFALICMWFAPKGCFLSMTLPIALVYTIYNIPSILIQRYNRPRLVAQYERLLKYSKKEDNINQTNS